MKDLHSLGALLRSTLGALGLERVEVTLALQNEWEELAGDPWAGASRPMVVRDGELTIEADSASTVRFLRYAIGDLSRKLDERFGEGVINNIVVKAPPTGKAR